MRNRGTGVAVPGLNSSAVRGLPILRPPEPVLASFDGYVAPFMARILANSKQNRFLTRMRDMLLPKLMRGEITSHRDQPATNKGNS